VELKKEKIMEDQIEYAEHIPGVNHLQIGIDALGEDMPNIIGFDVNSWGSCQYTGALDLYNVLNKLEEKFGFDEAVNKIGIVFKYDKIRSFDDIKKDFVEDITEYYVGRGTEEKRHQRVTVARRANNVDELFYACRNYAWDLWKAAPFIANLAFDNLIYGIERAPGRGPVGNVEVQGMNYETGFCCWLLKTKGIIQNEDSFKRFDT
jgi:hypothetical protein